jgi:hypothetical protein
VASAPHGHWETTTLVAGLRHQPLTVPLVTDGPMDGEMFLVYVHQFLCPTLRPVLVFRSPDENLSASVCERLF